jgi:RNA polymerase sigma-70 factor (ECF subfamily)
MEQDVEEARRRDAERREKLTALVLRRTKLTDDEAVLLREVFPRIVAVHEGAVWDQLRRRGLHEEEAEDLYQESFLTLYEDLVHHGFSDSLSRKIHAITHGRLLNYLRAGKRDRLSLGLPSSGSEKPRSGPNAERTLAAREVAERILSQLSQDIRDVVEQVIVHGLSHGEAADALRIPEGTVKSRLMAAKRDIAELAASLLPPSFREAT